VSLEALTRLLEHPAIWRGSGVVRQEGLPTGFTALDACLPGQGWPRQGLIEILSPQIGCGELSLLLPLLSALTNRKESRWCAWITPPHEPYAPALTTHGVAIDRILVVRAGEALWSFEQALRLGACDIALAWPSKITARHTRRLQLAAERGRAIGVLFRGVNAMRKASLAMLRLLVEPSSSGIRVRVLKGRGGRRDWISLSWNEAHALESS
jgi:cell division inhibitor SulA/protein ImuA